MLNLLFYTYFRLVSTGKISSIASGASVFRYDLDWDISVEEARAVSDHYPVHVKLTV